ncbi:MAG: isoaspartyl peptidase/L-asparaginase [Thermoprotei archaeon]
MASNTILIHGGAGVLRGNERLDAYTLGLRQAAIRGYSVLEQSSDATEAAVEAVRFMEESGAFNAGLGCTLTFDGKAEVDAGVMDGNTLSVGAVASLENIPHPVLAAKAVMENTDHVLLVGSGALRILEKLGFRQEPGMVNADKLRKLSELKAQIAKEPGRFSKNLKIVGPMGHDTVGAVALDSNGKLAAATSTGGYWLKLSGRVGDTPLAGAGFYADTKYGAAAATGIGEYAIRTCLAKSVVDRMRLGQTVQEACDQAIGEITRLFGSGTMGIVALDPQGNVGFSYNTQGMGTAYIVSGGEHSDSVPSPVVQVFKESPQ